MRIKVENMVEIRLSSEQIDLAEGKFVSSGIHSIPHITEDAMEGMNLPDNVKFENPVFPLSLGIFHFCRIDDTLV